MVNCKECGKKVKWGSEIEFESYSIETEYDEELEKVDKQDYEESKTVCKDCYEKLKEKEILRRKKLAEKIRNEKQKKESAKEKESIKEYGGKFQAETITHLKKIRSYIGWILAIILIGIIITMFSSCVSLMNSL